MGKNTRGAHELPDHTARAGLGREEHPIPWGNSVVLPGSPAQLPHGGNSPYPMGPLTLQQYALHTREMEKLK